MALYPTTAISICTGVGMLDYGVEFALRLCGRTLSPLLYVEREAFAAANLVWQMEQGFLAPAPVWSDVNTLTGPECREAVGEEPVDILFGGIPCQPHSQAGKQLRAEDPRDLWRPTAEAIACFRPHLVFIENVSGFLAGYGDGASVVCDELDEMGYRVTAGLFSSEECGASHQRVRCFVLAVAPGAGLQGGGAAREGGEVREGSGDGCEELGNASSDRRQAGPGVPEGAPGETEREPGTGSGLPELPFGTFEEDEARGRRERLRLPRYAPPQNSPLWELVATTRPDWLPAARKEAIESQFRGVAAGLASRPHRLRAVGNGVDPLVAGYAFLSLLACLEE